MDDKRIIKYLSDSIPKGNHSEPHKEYVQVRLDVIQEAIDSIEWMDKGITEWRDRSDSNATQAKAARATARIAINHLIAVLKHSDPNADASVAANEWLESIGTTR